MWFYGRVLASNSALEWREEGSVAVSACVSSTPDPRWKERAGCQTLSSAIDKCVMA